VGQQPLHTFYKPQGVPLEGLNGVSLSVEGLEAMRLADAESMDHASAAEIMGVSRPTFSRILNDGRQVVARALANGWAIHIDGGHFQISESPELFMDGGCRRRRKTGCSDWSEIRVSEGMGFDEKGKALKDF
jgi:predicted DNA-binding protein (UPF0251 family)